MNNSAKPKRTRTTARKSKINADLGAAAAMNLNGASSGTLSSIAAKSESKAARIIALLQRPGGASLDELVAETGWQSHTTRAALTGLRKKGHAISSEKADGVRRYHAAAAQ